MSNQFLVQLMRWKDQALADNEAFHRKAGLPESKEYRVGFQQGWSALLTTLRTHNLISEQPHDPTRS